MNCNAKPIKTTKKSSLHAITAPKPNTIKILSRKPCEKVCPVTCECIEATSKPEVAQAFKSVQKLKISELQRQLRSMAIDSKIANQVNVPNSKKLYKHLLPLEVNKKPATTVSAIKRPALRKDKEPVLSDYFQPKKIPEYQYTIPLRKTTNQTEQIYDGYRVYNSMQDWMSEKIAK